jgi:hypothetical protein
MKPMILRGEPGRFVHGCCGCGSHGPIGVDWEDAAQKTAAVLRDEATPYEFWYPLCPPRTRTESPAGDCVEWNRLQAAVEVMNRHHKLT